MITSKSRGNKTEFINNEWVYSDTKQPVALNHKERPCGNCGKDRSVEGHDACLGTLIGLMNACCGHGNIEEAYVQFWDGECIHGKDAKIIQDILKKHSKNNQELKRKCGENYNAIIQERIDFLNKLIK